MARKNDLHVGLIRAEKVMEGSPGNWHRTDREGRVHQMTVSGAVPKGKQSVELAHAATVIAATIADAKDHRGLFIVKNTSASGTEAHTLTLAVGTFDGTNKKATLDAPNEALIVYFDAAGNGTIVENVGAVGLAAS